MGDCEENVREITFDRLSEDLFSTNEDILEPCVVTKVFDVLKYLPEYARDFGQLFVADPELDGIYAECSAISNREIHRPRYYGGETVISDESSTTAKDFPHTESLEDRNVSSKELKSFCSVPHGVVTTDDGPSDDGKHKKKKSDDTVYTTVGGIDIFDDRDAVKHSLLSIHVSALKSQRRTSADAGGCPELSTPADELSQSGISTTSTARPHKRPLLTLQEAWRILQQRRGSTVKDPITSPRASLGQSPSSKLLSSPSPSRSAMSLRRSPTRSAITTPVETERVIEALRAEQGALYIKAPISQSTSLMETLQLTQFMLACDVKPQAVAAALALKPNSYCAFALLAEAGSGTRTHSNVMSAHAWHVLLKGRKRWLIANPLDRHLLTNPVTGEAANLLHIDRQAYPQAQHARIWSVVQHAGQALFLPSDALYCEVVEEESVAVLFNFLDDSLESVYEKETRQHSIILGQNKADSLEPELHPITTVDLVLFADNVYPSFRGKSRHYRPETRQDVLLLRSMVEFTQINVPCSEIGARVELEALQSCFAELGETLLDHYDPPRYVIGVPKGYLVSLADHRFILYYYVKAASLEHIEECIQNNSRVGQSFQHFHCRNITLPMIDMFRSTCSHQGRIPNYVPLSVLFNQIWPFERALCRRLVFLPLIILEKAKNPLGFIRTGSVWHYSRFDTRDDDVPDLPKSRAQLAEGQLPPKQLTAPDMTSASSALARATAKRRTSSFDTYVDNLTLEDLPGEGWCRTFLFYCSPLMDKPVALHPIESSATLQSGVGLTERGAPLPFRPRLVEFAWNVDTLEEYGMVSLLAFEKNGLAEIQKTIIHDPSFRKFTEFAEAHGMHTIDHMEEQNVEKVMAAVLWFLCRPCVVGFTFGGHTIPEDASSDSDGDNTSFEVETLCLSAAAASVLLLCVPDSVYTTIASALCNWLCHLENDDLSKDGGAKLFDMIREVLTNGTAEEQAIVFEVLRIKRENLTKQDAPALHFVDQEAHGFADKARLDEMSTFCQQFRENKRKEQSNSK